LIFQQYSRAISNEQLILQTIPKQSSFYDK